MDVARPAEWTPISAHLQQRSVELDLTLEEVLKGEVREPQGADSRRNHPDVQPRATLRFTALPGVWARHSLEVG